MTDAVTKISMEDYMKDFIPTLENFCDKSPLQPKIDYILETGSVKITSRYLKDFVYNFTVDPMTDKKIQIKELKRELEGNYPVLFDIKRIPYTPEEIEDLVAEGVGIKDAVNMRKEVSLPRYRIIRVHNRYNEIDLVDFKTKKVIKVKPTIPLITLLDKLYSFEPKDRLSSDFKKHTRFLHVIKD